jgi:hypothetical protein
VRQEPRLPRQRFDRFTQPRRIPGERIEVVQGFSHERLSKELRETRFLACGGKRVSDEHTTSLQPSQCGAALLQGGCPAFTSVLTFMVLTSFLFWILLLRLASLARPAFFVVISQRLGGCCGRASSRGRRTRAK